MNRNVDGLAILMISMYFGPETSGSAPYVTETARCYADAGHTVHVITTWPHYPAWRVNKALVEADDSQSRNLLIHRVATYVPRRPTLLKRLGYELVFACRAFFKSAQIRDIDVIVGCSPNLFSASLAAFLGRIRRKPVAQFVQDIVTAAAGQTGQASSGGVASKALEAIERRTLAAAARVVVPTTSFIGPLIRLGVPESKLRLVRNWSRLEILTSASRPTIAPYRILHTGNIGQKQALDLLIPTISRVHRADPRFDFVFVGDGNRRDALAAAIRGLSGVELLAPVAEADYATLLSEAAVLLVHERPGVVDMSLPSKLTSYFASGRPVVAVVDPDGATAQEVRQSGAGIVVQHDDPPALLAALTSIVGDSVFADQLGRAGQLYTDQVLSREAAFKRLVDLLSEMVGDLPEPRQRKRS